MGTSGWYGVLVPYDVWEWLVVHDGWVRWGGTVVGAMAGYVGWVRIQDLDQAIVQEKKQILFKILLFSFIIFSSDDSCLAIT